MSSNRCELCGAPFQGGDEHYLPCKHVCHKTCAEEMHHFLGDDNPCGCRRASSTELELRESGIASIRGQPSRSVKLLLELVKSKQPSEVPARAYVALATAYTSGQGVQKDPDIAKKFCSLARERLEQDKEDDSNRAKEGNAARQQSSQFGRRGYLQERDRGSCRSRSRSLARRREGRRERHASCSLPRKSGSTRTVSQADVQRRLRDFRKIPDIRDVRASAASRRSRSRTPRERVRQGTRPKARAKARSNERRDRSDSRSPRPRPKNAEEGTSQRRRERVASSSSTPRRTKARADGRRIDSRSPPPRPKHAGEGRRQARSASLSPAKTEARPKTRARPLSAAPKAASGRSASLSPAKTEARPKTRARPLSAAPKAASGSKGGDLPAKRILRRLTQKGAASIGEHRQGFDPEELKSEQCPIDMERPTVNRTERKRKRRRIEAPKPKRKAEGFERCEHETSLEEMPRRASYWRPPALTQHHDKSNSQPAPEMTPTEPACESQISSELSAPTPPHPTPTPATTTLSEPPEEAQLFRPPKSKSSKARKLPPPPPRKEVVESALKQSPRPSGAQASQELPVTLQAPEESALPPKPAAQPKSEVVPPTSTKEPRIEAASEVDPAASCQRPSPAKPLTGATTLEEPVVKSALKQSPRPSGAQASQELPVTLQAPEESAPPPKPAAQPKSEVVPPTSTKEPRTEAASEVDPAASCQRPSPAKPLTGATTLEEPEAEPADGKQPKPTCSIGRVGPAPKVPKPSAKEAAKGVNLAQSVPGPMSSRKRLPLRKPTLKVEETMAKSPQQPSGMQESSKPRPSLKAPEESAPPPKPAAQPKSEVVPPTSTKEPRIEAASEVDSAASCQRPSPAKPLTGATTLEEPAASTPDAVEASMERNFREWLLSLDNRRGNLLQYFDALKREFECDFRLLKSAIITDEIEGSLLHAIEPSLWSICGVKSIGHKMLLAKGIHKLK
ncbi:unnamed protein product [Durusdinium trenchii]|uniref:Uncharacterized protein n=1 Tax=Durusdinium trenchii TaxID=1381693 RepID=A0ABP0MUT8_9DINO